jgi:catechol 2,3-dioxygenase-like lactoylglutathione lyase family enzyme
MRPGLWIPARLSGVQEQPEPVQRISAVTLLTIDMSKAVTFYQALGFTLLYGGPETPFTSFRVGDGYLNLQLDPVGPRREYGGESCSGSRTST